MISHLRIVCDVVTSPRNLFDLIFMKSGRQALFINGIVIADPKAV